MDGWMDGVRSGENFLGVSHFLTHKMEPKKASKMSAQKSSRAITPIVSSVSVVDDESLTRCIFSSFFLTQKQKNKQAAVLHAGTMEDDDRNNPQNPPSITSDQRNQLFFACFGCRSCQ